MRGIAASVTFVLAGSLVLALAGLPGSGASADGTARCERVEAGPPGLAGDRLEVVGAGEVAVYRERDGPGIRVSYASQPCLGGPYTVHNVDTIVLSGAAVAVYEDRGSFAPGASSQGGDSRIEILIHARRLEYVASSAADRIAAATLAGDRVALDVDGSPGEKGGFDLIALDGLLNLLKIDGRDGDDLIDARRLAGMGDPQLRRLIRLDAGRGDDRVFGSPGVDWRLHDGPGDDLVRTGGGDDEVSMGRGRDTVYGGTGDDAIFYDTFLRFTGSPPDRRDRLFGGPGDDLIGDVNRHPDLIDCGPGQDRVIPEPRDNPAASCER